MNFRKKKKHQLHYFVSIGAGVNQIPLIKEAKKAGYSVIGVDANILAPGFMDCDLKIQESIENYEEIYQKLRELLVDGDIHAVMTRSYGQAIKTVSYLNEKFKIPFLPFQGSAWYMNKSILKKFLVENRILTPQPLQIMSKQDLETFNPSDFPLIVKPEKGHAKIDVKMLYNLKDLKKIISRKKTANKYIFEKFIRGDEIIAAGIIQKKIFHLICLTDKILTEPPHFVDLQHTAPSHYQHLSEKIEGIGRRITEIFNITTSPLIMEFVIDEKGALNLIEAVPEFGGEFLADILIPEFTGYSMIAESIKAITGTKFRIPVPGNFKMKGSVTVKYITGEKGTLVSFNPDGPQKVPGIIFTRIFKEIGSRIQSPVTNLDRIGVVIARGKSIEEANSRAETAIKKYNIRINK